MYTTTRYTANPDEMTISFSLNCHDWNILQQSKLWEKLDNYLEACQSTNSQMSLQERVDLLEMPYEREGDKTVQDKSESKIIDGSKSSLRTEKANEKGKATMEQLKLIIASVIGVVIEKIVYNIYKTQGGYKKKEGLKSGNK
ncbi:MAG: hypothetical protein NC311_15135 [Muribaculaceae bacterium]|nr:hypothetical protein [Muribaculaceae bacterium]MCM1400353.1 hypothetical protein [Clostridium sp.]MCM1461050.1 hypothetical protein [Bacteroides sp.]